MQSMGKTPDLRPWLVQNVCPVNKYLKCSQWAKKGIVVGPVKVDLSFAKSVTDSASL